nr:MAG TPA: hypothetical protein [Caudoviricetes sp.]
MTGWVYILIIGSNGSNISSSSTQLTRPKIQITSPLKLSLHINFSPINFLSFPNPSQTPTNTTLHPNLFQNTRIRYLSSVNFPIYHAYNSIKEHKTNSPQNTFILTLRLTITHFIPSSPILSKRPSNSIT